MSLMEYCDIRDGVLVPTYESLLVPIRCDWCEEKADSVAQAGACWVCPKCIGEMRGETRL
ncbi:MAG: hypothetical protein ACYCYP_02970 [Leptospirales bacterium]